MKITEASKLVKEFFNKFPKLKFWIRELKEKNIKVKNYTSTGSVYSVEFIGQVMKREGLSETFVASAIQVAYEYEGVYDLMKMWIEEIEEGEKSEIVADIQDMIDICLPKEKANKDEIKLKIGQVWQDWDIRFRNQTPRLIKIIGFPSDYVVRVENLSTKRKTMIRKTRMKPTSNGYKYIRDC